MNKNKTYKNSEEYKTKLIKENPDNWDLIHKAMNNLNFWTEEYEKKLLDYMRSLGNQQEEINSIIKWRTFRGNAIVRVLE